MTNEEIMAELRSDSPLNRARAVFSSAWGELEQAGMQGKRPGPVEIRGMEFDAVKRIIAAWGAGMTAERDRCHRQGTRIIDHNRKECIDQARSPEWYSHAPIGMQPEQARGYLAGKIDAWQHALEMMGHPDEL